jgi:hypothetical protein
MSPQGSHSACLTGDFAFKQRFASPDGALGRGLGGVMHAGMVRWISSAKIGSRLAPTSRSTRPEVLVVIMGQGPPGAE